MTQRSLLLTLEVSRMAFTLVTQRVKASSRLSLGEKPMRETMRRISYMVKLRYS